MLTRRCCTQQANLERPADFRCGPYFVYRRPHVREFLLECAELFQCASGHAVLGAGEMTFLGDDKAVFVERVTNQSTGYCPESESWQSVADALDEILVDRPDFFVGIEC